MTILLRKALLYFTNETNLTVNLQLAAVSIQSESFM